MQWFWEAYLIVRGRSAPANGRRVVRTSGRALRALEPLVRASLLRRFARLGIGRQQAANLTHARVTHNSPAVRL